jgi:hypothetical protein
VTRARGSGVSHSRTRIRGKVGVKRSSNKWFRIISRILGMLACNRSNNSNSKVSSGVVRVWGNSSRGKLHR